MRKLKDFDDVISGQEEIESKDSSVSLTQEHEFMYHLHSTDLIFDTLIGLWNLTFDP